MSREHTMNDGSRHRTRLPMGPMGLLAVVGLAVVISASPAEAYGAGTVVGPGASQGSGTSQGASVSISLDDADIGMSSAVKILALLTVITLVPSMLLLMTSFTRIIIVFSFVRHAIGTQQMPPNQVLIGLALFLTMFVMAPVWAEIHDEAIVPREAGEISQEEAIRRAVAPVERFMLSQTREEDLALFYSVSDRPRPAAPQDVAFTVLVPAFVISELKTAFQMGFLLFVPFLLVDMVVSSILMGMGMMMLPPVIVSLPLKIMLFVLADGWNLLVGSLLRSFEP